MNAKDASKMIIHLCGIESLPPNKLKDVETAMELILASRQASEAPTMPKELPNELPQEDNTINLQDVAHFDIPKDVSIQMEGEDAIRKIKIFPDGISEAEATPSN